MLIPTKHMNLRLSVIKVSSLILKILIKDTIVKYDKLLNTLIRRLGEDVIYVITPALSFLYLQGVIEYNQKNDTFIFVKKELNNET